MIDDSFMLVGKCVSVHGTDLIGGIVLNRTTNNYKFEVVSTNMKFVNGSIDEMGVHINHTPDDKVPTYTYKDGKIIPIDNCYLLVGIDNQFYHIVCGTSVCFVEKHSILNYNISGNSANYSDEELEEYMNYFIEDSEFDYVCNRVVNFEATNHLADLYTFEGNRKDIITNADIYPTFESSDIELLKEVLLRSTRNGVNYRFIYIDDGGIESYFEYKWYNNSLVLYFVYITNDELMAECDYIFWDKGLTLYLVGDKNNRDKLSIQANDVVIFEIADFKYFGIKANSVSFASNKSISPIMLYDIDRFEVTANNIDTEVAEIRNGKYVTGVNNVALNIGNSSDVSNYTI